MIKEFKIKSEYQLKDINGLSTISIQAYKEFNPFGIEFIKFYSLRDYTGFTSHNFIKTIKAENIDIDLEIKNVLKELINLKEVKNGA